MSATRGYADKDELVAELGHELRNQLVSMTMVLDLLKRARHEPEQIDAIIPMLDKDLTRLKRFVEQQLDSQELTEGALASGATDSQDDATVAASSTNSSPERRRVLVVDDNVDAADSLCLVLEARGHESQAAYDGAEALDKLEAFAADVVLLDIGLPQMDGLEVARRIRSTARGKEITLVAVTGWGQDEDRQRTTEAGFDAHLTKPVDSALLVELISRHPGR